MSLQTHSSQKPQYQEVGCATLQTVCSLLLEMEIRGLWQIISTLVGSRSYLLVIAEEQDAIPIKWFTIAYHEQSYFSYLCLPEI